MTGILVLPQRQTALVANANYKNSAFCPWGTVWNYYRTVVVEATGTGVVLGWVEDTWTTYPLFCLHLHWHSRLEVS